MPRSLLLLPFLLLVVRSQVVPACPNDCECSDSEVKCVSAQWTSIPQYITTTVQILDLKNNSIRELSRDDLGIYTSAHVLDLTDNNLERIDEGAFESSSALLKLSLGGNQLENVFEQTFAGLESLAHLNLTGNILRNVLSSLRLKRLRELYLGYNQLESIGEDDFRGIHNVRILDLRSNMISKIHPLAFSPLNHLRFLILRNNPLRHAASNLVLSHNVWLHVLDLTNCKIKKELVKLPKRLRDVRLSYNNLTNITIMFKEARYIDMIILNDNNLLYVDPGALNALPYLRELWLNRNRLEKIPRLPEYIRAVHIDDNLIDTVDSNSFKVTPFVEIISLQNNKITRLPSESFRNLRLRMIDVSMNEIAVLQRYTFSNLPVLYSVDLSRNPIQRLDIHSFDNVTNLHWLQMARTKVDMVEVESLEMLHLMKKLQYLDLTSSPGVANKLIDSGVVLEEVRTLNLMFNDLRTLPSTFPKQIPNIRLLHLSGNKWHCNSSLSWLPDYILENEKLFFSKSHIVCYTPLKWRSRAIHTLEINEMNEVTGPPAIDKDLCPDCKEPCDTKAGEPEVIETDGGTGAVEGGTSSPESGNLRQSDGPATRRKVEKFKGKILMTTSIPVLEEAGTAGSESSSSNVVASTATVEPSGGEEMKFQSLSLATEPATQRTASIAEESDGGAKAIVSEKSEKVTTTIEADVTEVPSSISEASSGPPANPGSDASSSPTVIRNENAPAPKAYNKPVETVASDTSKTVAHETPRETMVTTTEPATTEDAEIQKQKKRDDVVWSMMSRMFKF